MSALDTINDKIPEPLKRQVGPFPLWVWLGGVAGGLVLYSLRSDDGGSPSGNDEPAEAEEFDFEAIAGPGLPAGSLPGSGGSTGGSDTGGSDDSGGGTDPITGSDILDSGRFICPIGFKKHVNAAGKATCRKVVRPKARKGYKLEWNWKGEKWRQVKTKSFTPEEPHIEVMGAPNGAPPTLTMQNVPGIGIAAPDRTPRVEMEPLNARAKRGETDQPLVLMRVPPAPNARTQGRPFHGANSG